MALAPLLRAVIVSFFARFDARLAQASSAKFSLFEAFCSDERGEPPGVFLEKFLKSQTELIADWTLASHEYPMKMN